MADPRRSPCPRALLPALPPEELRERSAALAAEAERLGGPAARHAVLRALFHSAAFDAPPLSGPPYDAWRELTETLPPKPESGGSEEEGREAEACSAAAPSISLLMPVYNPRPEHLEAALASVRGQTWGRWECCVADDCSTDPAVGAILRRHAAEDKRIRVAFRSANGHIVAASNAALALARAPWCALMDHDDVLDSRALARMAEAAWRHPRAAVLFSDEDQLEDGEAGAPPGENRPRLDSPLFKPGFDPDLLLACNSVSHLGMYRTALLRRLGGFGPGTEGAQDHDLALRCLAETGPESFVHVPGVLYHWRRHAGSTAQDWGVKAYAREASLAARRRFAETAGLAADIRLHPGSLYAEVCFRPPSPLPLLTVCLLADVDAAMGNGRWVRAVAGRCAYAKRELVVAAAVDVLSGAAVRSLERAAVEARAVFLPVAGRGGAVGLARAAAEKARGKALAFVRTGDVPLADDWAARAIGALWRSDVAAVGCRSRNPQGFLAQAGYALGLMAADGGQPEGTAALCPAYAGLHAGASGYFRWAHLLRSAPAVYLSGMVCRRELYVSLGGLDGAAGLLADADFCLRAWTTAGLRSVVLPDADFLTPAIPSPVLASGVFAARWEHLLRTGVPFQNPWLLWTPGGWRLRPPRA